MQLKGGTGFRTHPARARFEAGHDLFTCFFIVRQCLKGWTGSPSLKLPLWQSLRPQRYSAAVRGAVTRRAGHESMAVWSRAGIRATMGELRHPIPSAEERQHKVRSHGAGAEGRILHSLGAGPKLRWGQNPDHGNHARKKHGRVLARRHATGSRRASFRVGISGGYRRSPVRRAVRAACGPYLPECFCPPLRETAPYP